MQHINLYPNESEHARPHLNGVTVWVYSFALSLFMIVAIVWSHIDYKDMQKLADKTQMDFSRLMSQYESANQKLVKQIGGEGAEEAIKRLEVKLEKNRSLLEVLQFSGATDVDIPGIVQNLRLHSVDGLKVERIAVTKSGSVILLEGESDHSGLVANYISYLKTLERFKDRVFTTVSYKNSSRQGKKIFKLSIFRRDALPDNEQYASVDLVENELDRNFSD